MERSAARTRAAQVGMEWLTGTGLVHVGMREAVPLLGHHLLLLRRLVRVVLVLGRLVDELAVESTRSTRFLALQKADRPCL